MSSAVRRWSRRRLARRGQSGMTLLETLLALMMSALMVLPVFGWTSLALREQHDVSQRNLSGASLGVLRTVFTRDVVNSDRAWVDGEHLEDCVLSTKGARPLVALVSGNRHTVYATTPDHGEGDSQLVRAQCASSGGPAAVERELVGDVIDAGTDATCATVSQLAELEAARSPKFEKDAGFEARLADQECSRVTLRVTTGQLDQIALTATRRSSPSSTVDADAPIAVVAADPTTGLVPLKVAFDGSSSVDPRGEEISYKWDFGDGTGGEGPSVGHGYSKIGTYTATLTVTTTKTGRSATAAVLITVGSNAPVAAIAAPASGTTVHRGQKVSFSSKGSGDPADEPYGAKPVSYLWDFGDGTGSAEANPTKVYSALSAASGYDVKLTVTDDTGLIASASIKVVVANRIPTVAVTANPSSGTAPLSVTFTGTVVDEPDMASPPKLKYAWDFGNGTTSSAAAPGAVTYSTAGTYTAKLTVTDDQGESASGSQTVTVTEKPLAAPVNLRKTKSGSEKGLRYIDMAWDRRDGATRYEVELDCVSCSEVATNQASGTTLRISGLSKGAKQYDARVRAQSPSGTWGPWSEPLRVKS